MPLLMLKDLPPYESVLEAAKHYPTLDPSANEAFLNLLRTADMMTLGSRGFLSRHQISHGRFTVMMLLHRPWVKIHTPASLAEQAGVTRATMTGLIDTLERDGLVSRSPEPQDRRITHIELTDKGRERLKTMIPECFSMMAGAMAPLNERERKELVRLLQKIQASVAEE